MGHCERMCYFTLLAAFLFITFVVTSATADDRCKDASFCDTYCSSTNPDTVRTRCGTDLASCICTTRDNHSVKVRFIEERTPVPPTPSTTPRPASSILHGVKYVDSQSQPQSLPNAQFNGNGNSIGGASAYNQQPQRQQQNQMTPLLLECDGSEMPTRMCHLFCTKEIRAWYGMCKISSKACACFGIAAVQQEPIAAIFHPIAPVTPAPYTTTTTSKPSYSPPRPGYQQLYPPQQYLHQQSQPQQQQQQHQQWRPIQPANANYNNAYHNNNQYYPASSPTVLNAVASSHNHNQANLVVPNGLPMSASISTPTISQETTLKSVTPVSSTEQHTSATSTGDEVKVEENLEHGSTIMTRKRRSIINETGDKKKGNASVTGKTVASVQGDCSKFKCAIACKRNNYFAPDCQPKCIDGECWCECFPRL